MKFTCPNCQTLLDVPDAVAQAKLECSVCGQHVLIEPDAAASPTSHRPRATRMNSRALAFIACGLLLVACAAATVWYFNAKLPAMRFDDAHKSGRNAEAREQWDEAHAAYTIAAKLRPDDAETADSLRRVAQKKTEHAFRAALSDGQRAEAARDWRAALAHYEKALSILPDEPTARAAQFRMFYFLEIETAQAAEQTKQWQRAAESYQRALTLKPADPTATEALTRIAYLAAIESAARAEQQKQWDAAAQSYTEALRHKPNDPAASQALRRLAETQQQELFDAALRRATQAEQARQWDAAARAFKDALESKPHDPAATEALRRIAESQRQQRYDTAFARATEAERQRNWRDAEQFYQEALHHKPNDPLAAEALQRIAFTAVLERAQQLEARREWHQAAQAFQEALRIKPNDPLAVQGLRRISEADAAARYDAAMRAAAESERRKDWDNAVNAYNAALQLRPNDAQAMEGLRRIDYLRHLERARLFEERRDWQTAMISYREALRFHPNDPLCLEGMHRIEQIIAAENFNALMNQATHAERNRDWNSAAHFYNEALRFQPGHPAAVQGLRRLDETVAQENYNAAMKRGAELEQRRDWNGALAQYREAQRIRRNDFAAAESIRRVEELIRLEPYNEAIRRASQAESNRRWREAIEQYQRALSVKPADSTAAQGLQRAQYSDAMERAQQAEQRRDWNCAAQFYSEALSHRPGDATANEGLRRARENLNRPPPASHTPPPSPPSAAGLTPAPNPSPQNPRPPNPPAATPAPTTPQPPATAAPQPPASKPPKSAAPASPEPPPQPAVPPEVAAAYQAAMNDAAVAAKKLKWTEAIAHYEAALAVLPDDIVAIRSLRDAKFQDAMLRGTQALRTGNRDEAAAAFREAHSIIPEDKAPVEALRRMGLRPEENKQR
jgi:tetratricopeptide (TPR) repeat protein